MMTKSEDNQNMTHMLNNVAGRSSSQHLLLPQGYLLQYSSMYTYVLATCTYHAMHVLLLLLLLGV
jgi:hypothetical protein